LFNNAEVHQEIVAAMAARHYGISHTEILQQTTQAKATGSYQRAIEELLVSDFIVENTPFEKKKRGSNYRLIDEFSVFYHYFIKPNKKYTLGLWQQLAEGQSYKVWAGYAFETLCHKHIDPIKRALGIGAVYTKTYSLNIPGTTEQEGFQIDLLIDRKDNCINLCEIKFHSGPFVITKNEYHRLLEKRQCFIEFTGTKKTVFLTFITNHGIAPNAYSQEIVDAEVRLEQLLEGNGA
jgi:uncharacterized protein